MTFFLLLITFGLISHVCLAQETRTITVTQPQSTSPSYVDDATFQKDVLSVHNRFRGQHNASMFSWNVSLAQTATAWVDRCVWAHSRGPTGENLAAGFANATAAVDAWGNERDHFDFQHPDFSEQTGHFTQVVWKATTSVGCGRKLCTTSTTPGWYVVCEYWPAGNVIGNFKQNVAVQMQGPGTSGSRGGKLTSDGSFGPMKGNGPSLKAPRSIYLALMFLLLVVIVW